MKMHPVKLALITTLLGSLSLLSIGCSNAPESPKEKKASASASRTSVVDVRAFPASYEKETESVGFREISSADINSNASQRFEIVENSGMDFVNIFDRSNFQRLIETGSGLAIGDYDNDGEVDVYLLSTDGPNRLYRGLGDFKFEDTTQAAGVDGSIDGDDVWGAGASFADIDNDGDLDLFVCNMAAENLLYVNNGDGTFSEQTDERGLKYFGASKIGSFCDYDRDGDLDLFLLTYQEEEPINAKMVTLKDGTRAIHPDDADKFAFILDHLIVLGEKDILYENDGEGNFKDVSQAAGIEGMDMGLSATWFDVNNDDWPDLYVANDFKGPDKLYKNNGNGTFTNIIGEVTMHTPWFSMGSCAGDLNNDGFDDLMVADMSGVNHYKQKVNMGEMSASSWFLTYGHPRQAMRNALYVNTGAGRFLETAFQSNVDSTDWTWAVRFADFDNDGLQDIYVTNGRARSDTNSDVAVQLKEKKKQSMEEFIEFKKNLPPINEKNLAFKNMGDFRFEPVGDQWNLSLNGVSHGVAMADFDHDGDLDMVVNNLNEKATLYENCSSGNRLGVELRGVESNVYGYGARVEIWTGEKYQSRRLHPVSGYLSSDQPVLHFGLADVTDVDRMLITWPNGKRQELLGLKANRIYRVIEDTSRSVDLETREVSPLFTNATKDLGVNFVATESDFDDYQREPLLPYQPSRLGSGNSVADVNGDGYPDLFVGAPNPQSAKLYLSDKGQKFVEKKGPWESEFLTEDMGALFFDADGDGDQDLYIARGSNEFAVGNSAYRDRLYLNDGQANFILAEGALPDLRDSSSCVAACDFDRDGDLDLFVGARSIPGRYPETPNSRLLINDGDGSFVDGTEDAAEKLADVGLVTSATWADYDSDGWTDLIVTLDWGPVTFFRNVEGTLTNQTEALSIAGVKGWWHGIAAGDFDNDGDLDFVATNQGLNTKYHCDPKHPHRIYFSDFDDSGTLDLVEAEFEDGTEFPVRGRSCSSNSMPFIAEKFDTYHDFAIAPLEDIYTEEIRSKPFVEVTDLRTSVIWNDGEKGMRIEALPWMAQISPGFGVEAGDFDGDGNHDIMLSQNFFASQAETGYMDGGVGLLLLGDGKGGFESQGPSASGIVIPEDGTALTTGDIDLDGDLDTVASTNNGPLRIFRNQSEPRNRRVNLVGDDSNRLAIGASVIAVRKDGVKQAHRIAAGGSYLGQSDATLLIGPNVETLIVTWPDGARSEHVVPGKSEGSQITIEKE